MSPSILVAGRRASRGTFIVKSSSSSELDSDSISSWGGFDKSSSEGEEVPAGPPRPLPC